MFKYLRILLGYTFLGWILIYNGDMSLKLGYYGTSMFLYTFGTLCAILGVWRSIKNLNNSE